MGNKIIQDYGKTVTPELYLDALQGHQYIPQSDQCILNTIKSYRDNVWGKEKTEPLHIIDIGCGPGRLTHKIGKMGPEYFTYGLDISESFIAFAKKNNPYGNQGYFLCEDFSNPPQNSFVPSAEIILMQGVMHHINEESRKKFLQRSFDLLHPNGILIIGDEFIKDYETEEERRSNVCKFYLHIIDEARKGGFNELAEEEAKNLIDDVLSGESGAGFANEEVFEKIYNSAELNNKSFYEHGYIFNQNITGHLIPWLKEKCSQLAVSNLQSFNRGDLKVSTKKFKEELQDYNFILEKEHQIGPVEQLGGMAVMVFKKK